MGLIMGLSFLVALVPPMALSWFVVSPATLGELKLSGVFAAGFVELASNALWFLIIVGITGYFLKDQLRIWWHNDRPRLLAWTIGPLVAMAVLSETVFPNVFGAATSSLILCFFAPGLERRWGRDKLLMFVVLVGSITYGLIATLMATGLIGGAATGARPLIEGLLTAWALSLAGQRLQLLNIEASKLVWVLVAINVIYLIGGPPAEGLSGLFAIAIAWMLVRGTWRPRLLIDRLRLLIIEQRLKRRRQGFTVIKGGRDRDRYH